MSASVLLVLSRKNVDADAVARFRAAVPQADVAVLDTGHDIAGDAAVELADLVAERLG